MGEVRETPSEVDSQNPDVVTKNEKVLTFADIREKAWQKSQETLNQWQIRIQEKVEEKSAGINQHLKDLSTLYGEQAPENVVVSLQYFPREGSQKGEPINNFVESGRLEEDTADVLYWISNPIILPTDTPDDVERIYEDITNDTLTRIIHEIQHRSFQREGFQELIKTSEQHPDVKRVLVKLESVRGDYIEVTNELITTYLENFGRKRIEEAGSSAENVSTPITVEVDKEKSGNVLEAVVKEDIEGWRDKGKGPGPYTDLREQWEKEIGGLPESYQTREEDGDVTHKDSDRTYTGARVYEIARELDTGLAEKYVEQGREMDIEFVVELYRMVDEKLESSEADGIGSA